MHEFFALPTAFLVRLHFNAHSLGTLNYWYKYASRHLCVFFIKFHVRWNASESNCSDDPSRRHDSSQHASRDFSNNFLTVLSPHVLLNR